MSWNLRDCGTSPRARARHQAPLPWHLPDRDGVNRTWTGRRPGSSGSTSCGWAATTASAPGQRAANWWRRGGRSTRSSPRPTWCSSSAAHRYLGAGRLGTRPRVPGRPVPPPPRRPADRPRRPAPTAPTPTGGPGAAAARWHADPARSTRPTAAASRWSLPGPNAADQTAHAHAASIPLWLPRTASPPFLKEIAMSRRVSVPAELRPWSVPWRSTTRSTSPRPKLRADGRLADSVRAGWAEPATDPTHLDLRPRQAAALLPYTVVDGRPRNPTGRTGRTGRNLGRWGENAAADPIVVTGAATGRRVLLIRREDCGQWAIPGGMVEAGVDLTEVTPIVLWRGYVDDPCATDEAWVCSTAALFRVPAALHAHAGDDALEVRWWPFDSLDMLRRGLRCAGDQ